MSFLNRARALTNPIVDRLRFISAIPLRKICSRPKINEYSRSKCSSLAYFNNCGRHFKSKISFIFMAALPLVANDNASPEEKIDIKIQEGLLLIEGKEYAQAERKLHAALKVARDARSDIKSNYIFSILANLAFTVQDYDKAELLYIDLLQKMITLGFSYDSNEVMHVSVKLSIIYAVTDQHEKALAGYEFCIEKMKPKVENGEADLNGQVLYGMAQEAYGNYLVRGELYDEALERLVIAYDICQKVKGPKDPQVAVLLNGRGKVAVCKKNYEEASELFEAAYSLARDLGDEEAMIIFLINLGNLKMLQELDVAAIDYCNEALTLCGRVKNHDMALQAEACLKSAMEYGEKKRRMTSC